MDRESPVASMLALEDVATADEGGFKLVSVVNSFSNIPVDTQTMHRLSVCTETTLGESPPLSSFCIPVCPPSWDIGVGPEGDEDLVLLGIFVFPFAYRISPAPRRNSSPSRLMDRGSRPTLKKKVIKVKPEVARTEVPRPSSWQPNNTKQTGESSLTPQSTQCIMEPISVSLVALMINDTDTYAMRDVGGA
ncbi:hypothetical protein AMATHDRAFT_87609 [Amanita thiersii Skay4041]|uniref:Uncharacterized protein n=1 Tax=Amanita thiersii Skay4041 TaxID=703135 RepID=A0A2A9NH89_9AGAR|nr:hypothetical protein AMATHDRAFT_87609 [Amanita thiersii Skay4041]